MGGKIFCHCRFFQSCSGNFKQLWINLKAENFPLSWVRAGLFCHKNQSCSNLPEMDLSKVRQFWATHLVFVAEKGFSATKTTGWGKIFWLQIYLISGNYRASWGGGFCGRKGPPKMLKIAFETQIYLKSRQFSLNWGGRVFVAEKPPLAQDWGKQINLTSKDFPSSWGGQGISASKNQSCWFLPGTDKSEVKKFSPIMGGKNFLTQKPEFFKIAETA